MDLQNVFSAAPAYKSPSAPQPLQPAAPPAPRPAEPSPPSQPIPPAHQPAPPPKPSPQLTHPVPQAATPAQPVSAQNSPRMLNGRPPSAQGARVKSMTPDPRRLSSSAGVQKSPVVSNATVETLPLLLYVAEDCLSKAKASAKDIAGSMGANEVAEHHKLLSTGLTCLEVAMQANTLKSKPRLEAKILLRYASTLVEETNNLMEAEVALKKVQTIAETNRFLDLNYSAQFILMKAVFQRNSKAALKTIDQKISDCTTYKHVHWIYAFRFLKASFYLQLGTAADHHALENLRAIGAIAKQRGDKAIFVLATLMEGLAHLGTPKDDATTRVQTCIAQASTYQLEASVHLPQIDVLLMFLDLACSLLDKAHDASNAKWSSVQTRLGELHNSPAWDEPELLLPISKQSVSSQSQAIVSQDTSAILRPGSDGTDFLVLAALGRRETDALAYTLSGLAQLHKAVQLGASSSIWSEGLKLLEDAQPISYTRSLPEALKDTQWETELACYTNMLIGLQSATLCEWPRVERCLAKIEKQQLSGCLELLALYLKGVFKQGTAKLADAIKIWQDPRFALDTSSAGFKPAKGRVESDLAILAALNRMWIMQNPEFIDEAKVQELIDFFTPVCVDHPDKEIKTACNLALAAIYSPALTIHKSKRHIQLALSASQETSNNHHLSISLNVLRCRLFENVVGVQALKSAKAGSTQAKRGGNILWMSVAEGMLAQSFEMQNSPEEARAVMAAGTQHANEAMAKINQCSSV
ncbi:hypothetical protein GQ53DRAFT_787290 [Thozetella sp. PMI_491]|nr:hypothetical protein GQ53DRAFT_787290 [Thozetella sp. PMI_491]